MNPTTTQPTSNKLPNGNFPAGNYHEHGHMVSNVVVKCGGGMGGDPLYAGGYVDGFVGHAASLISAAAMRRLAAALTAAAEAIEASGLPSYQEFQEQRRQKDK